MSTTTYGEARRAECPGCHGTVRLPAGSRRFNLDTIMALHRDSCPATPAPRKPDAEMFGRNLTPIDKGQAPTRTRSTR